MKTFKKNNQHGIVLLGLIITITVLGLLSSVMVTMVTSSTYSQSGVLSILQAYYMAESGGRFGIYTRQQNTIKELIDRYKDIYYSVPLSDGEEGLFNIRFKDTNPEYEKAPVEISSTGISDKGHFLEAVRKIKYIVNIDVTQTRIETFTTADFDIDNANRIWNVPKDVQAKLMEGPIVGNDPAIELSTKGQDSVTISLNWQKNEIFPDLAKWQDTDTKALTYQIQIKTQIYKDMINAKHFMVGVSFRLDSKHESAYGLSFFQSSGRSRTQYLPSWIRPVDEECTDCLDPKTFVFSDEVTSPDQDALDVSTPYVIVWEKNPNIPYTLLGYKKIANLPESDNLLDENGKLKPWSTLFLSLDEKNFAGVKINIISAHIQGTSDSRGKPIYARNSPISWDEDKFIKVIWNNGKSEIMDESLTSKDLNNEQPDEIGIHVFYDRNYRHDIFFDDYGMRCYSTCPSNPGQSIIQM